MRKFIMDKYNLIAFAIGLIPTILLYLFPPGCCCPLLGIFYCFILSVNCHLDVCKAMVRIQKR